jgi:hypothetical protein
MVYLLISVLILNSAAYFVPKHLKRQEIYSTALFSFLLGLTIDVIFALKYHLYGYFAAGVQMRSFLAIAGLFPATGILYLNFYPAKESILKQFIYILSWTAFCLFYEWTAIISGFFYYSGWKMYYSALTYPVLLIMHLIHLSLFRHLKNRGDTFLS